MKDVLKKIVEEKKESIKSYKKSFSINELNDKISENNNYLNFEENLRNNKISVIAEIKKASPSAGIIIQNYNPVQIAKHYCESGASCLSILTEERHFLGALEHIKEVKKEVSLPVLCKDFFLESYQVHLAKSFGADAVLIILSVVDENIAQEIYETAEKLNMSTIIEIHTEKEAKIALKFKNSIIGINNRNLKTLETSIETTFDLYKILGEHSGLLLCESGIKSGKDVSDVVQKTGIKNFLIGESLLKNFGKKSNLLKEILKIDR